MAERRVGVALDFSDNSKYALSWALENLIRLGDIVFLIVVQKMEDEDGVANLWEVTGSPLVTLREMKDSSTARKYHIPYDSEMVEELEATARTKDLTVNAKVYFGDARVKIVEAVAEHKIDALVMGNRGMSGIKRIFLGSVSNYVVNNVPCPVTIVKLPEHVLDIAF
ncbi:unnamed protein product [Calypogeia fissa]